MTARVETRAEDGAMHIAVSGEIDLANAAAVEDQIREALSHSPETVSVDLTRPHLYGQRRNKNPLHPRVSAQAAADHAKTIVALDSPTRRFIELSGFESLASLQPQSQ